MAQHILDEGATPSEFDSSVTSHSDIEEDTLARRVDTRQRRCIGAYQLDDRIGGGGMAEIWAAWAPELAARVAVKRMRPELASSTLYKAMFCEEARISALLSKHPNIVQLIDFDLQQCEPFMVFEYVDGISVSRLMRLSWVRKEPIPPAVALFIARQTLIALEFAHHARDERGAPLGLVHRDVSPENILVARNGEVKLTDFGIVRTRASSRSTLPGGLKGKLGYMSPEQIAGDEIDLRSDLFALGIVLAEMLTHAPLFRGLDELELLTRMYQADLGALPSAELSRELRALLTRALEPRCASRFQSALEFQCAIEEVARASGLELDVRQIEEWFSEIGIFPRQSGTFRVAGLSAPDHRELLERIGSARELFAGSSVANSNALGLDAGSRRTLRETPTQGSAAYLQEAHDPCAEARARAAAFCFGPTAVSAEWSSPLRRADLARVLCDIVLQRRTGLLQACNGLNEKRLYFADGGLLFIASTEAEELLGRRLIAEGVLRSREVERGLKRAAQLRCRLGEALVADGVLPAHVVLRAVIAQLMTRFFELGAWHEGSLAFFDGEEPGMTGIRVQTAPLELVFDLVRQAYSVAELRRLLTPIAQHPLQRATPRDDGAHLPFSPAEQRVIGAVDGRSSLNALVAGLAASAQIAPTDTYRAVFLGLSAGGLVSPSADMAQPVAAASVSSVGSWFWAIRARQPL